MARALLVVDVQNDLVDALPAERRGELLTTVAELLREARMKRIPVVYVRHNEEGPLRLGTPAWEIASAVGPQEEEPIVEKRFGDAFQETDLAEVLAARGIDDLVICGMQSDFCIDATTRGAAKRGYRVTLVENAHATYGSDGKTERDIIDALHEELRGKGIRLSSASTAFT